jgi:hypothetical protein
MCPCSGVDQRAARSGGGAGADSGGEGGVKPKDTIGNFTSRAGTVRVRNALNPLLWTMALVVPTSWIAAYFFRDEAMLEYALFGVGALPIFATLVAYFIFMFRDPNRLQSEEYQLRHEVLQILHKRGDVNEVVDVAADHLDLSIEEGSWEVS